MSRRGGRAALGLMLMALGLLPAACAPPPPPPAVKARPGALRPEFHQPAQWWQDHHMQLLGQNPSSLSLAQCRVCHQPSQACRPCHAYVGLPPGEADHD